MTYRAHSRKSAPKDHTEVMIVKLKRVLLLALVFCLALPSAQAAEKKKVGATIYNGIITRRFANSYTNVYEKMDSDSKVVRTMSPGNKIEIVEITPGWVGIRLGSDVGYVLRHRIDVTDNPNPGTVFCSTAACFPFKGTVSRILSIYKREYQQAIFRFIVFLDETKLPFSSVLNLIRLTHQKSRFSGNSFQIVDQHIGIISIFVCAAKQYFFSIQFVFFFP